jgi:DNA-directed RNA polymerase alpha subunit
VDVFDGLTETPIPANCLAEKPGGQPSPAELLAGEIKQLLERGRWEAAHDLIDRAERIVANEPPGPANEAEYFAVPLVDTRLNLRTTNYLEREGWTTIGDVANLPDSTFMAVPNFGVKQTAAVRAELARIWAQVRERMG